MTKEKYCGIIKQIVEEWAVDCPPPKKRVIYPIYKSLRVRLKIADKMGIFEASYNFLICQKL